MKPWSGLAAMMLLLSMALFVASMASSQWLETTATGLTRHEGPFEACVNDWKNNVHECHRLDNSCTAAFSQPVGPQSLGNCVYARVSRAFMIMGLIFAGLAFVAAWLGYNSYDDLMYRLPAMLFSLLSMTMGLIGWAVWTAMAQKDYGGEWRYSWGHGLALGAWLLPLAASVACIIPSPARDLKAGEEIARGTAHGRRGSWADLFSSSWWSRGSDWGQREVAGGPRGAGAPLAAGAPGTTYEERAAYRGDPLRRDEPGHRATESGYGYRESPREAERLERERQLGREADPRAKGWIERTGEALTGKHEHGAATQHDVPVTTERHSGVV